MKKLLFVLAALIMLAPVAVTAGGKKKAQKGEYTVQEGKLKIAMEIGYPPFEYYAEDGKTPVGFDVELGKEIAKRLGLNVEFVDTAWDGILAGLDTDRYDVIMSAMTITEDRQKNYLFANPYIGNAQVIILTKDSKLDITTPDQLAGKKVGYQAETTSDFYIEKYAQEHNFKFEENEYDKVMNAYDDLKFGRIDAVFSDGLVAVDYLGKKDSVYKQVWSGTPDEYFGPCVKKTNTVLCNKINQALESIAADGTMKQIYEKIFGVDLTYTLPNK